MPPAARVTDMHVCPQVTVLVPHVGGPIIPPCCPTVLIGFLPAARVTDMAVCVGPLDSIMMGSPTVMIGNLMAARVGDPTVHGGNIVLGCFTVIIGNMGTSFPAMMAEEVNPLGSVINCGNIIDAVIDRFTGKDPSAVAPDKQDGTFEEIEKRHGTKIQWGHNFQDAFNAVRKGGDGTIAILGIQYSDPNTSHVVVMTNDHGNVGIVEAQDWGKGNPPEVITDPARANQRYNSDGGSDVGIGMVRTGR
jgi:uncharacterized Zn-binding protein involved in type VI secretion